jgi:hypothetical protein
VLALGACKPATVEVMRGGSSGEIPIPNGPPPLGGGGGPVDVGPIIEPGDPGAGDVQFVIRADEQNGAISPYIYGSNRAENANEDRPGVIRLGGNRWTTYNWENNASNAGSDYCFISDGYLGGGESPGGAVKGTVEIAKSISAGAVVTIPIVDYVAADKNGMLVNGSCDPDNSEPYKNNLLLPNLNNYISTRFKRNYPTRPGGGGFPSTPVLGDADVFQDEFVNWLRWAVPGATVFFDLDNEPDLWADTHAEIHPNKATYAEVVDKNRIYAESIKTIWPEVKILGPVSYGWSGFESLQDAPDEGTHGNFLDFYLKQMKQAETNVGYRLVDFLDLHWYPEALGSGQLIRDSSGIGDLDPLVEARIQAPRSLWDETYSEDSWIAQWSTLGPIKLIPRMKQKIADNYPGTKLAFTEWNFGGGRHISGGIAAADVLGIFGREGVGLASYFWFVGYKDFGDEEFIGAALRVYRNFDGNGATFGDTSLKATTSDRVGSSIYASLSSAKPNQVVLVAINKKNVETRAAITLAHSKRFSKADVYTLTASGGAQLVKKNSLPAVDTNAFNYRMPPRSASVLAPEP